MLPFIIGVLTFFITIQVGSSPTVMEPIDLTRPIKQSKPSLLRLHAQGLTFKYCHDPVLAMKIMRVESNYRSVFGYKESSTGLMQVKPETAQWIGCRARQKFMLLFPSLNIQCGCKYLYKLAQRYSKVEEVIVAYNAGSAIKCRTGRLNNGSPCEIGKYINDEYLQKVTKAEI